MADAINLLDRALSVVLDEALNENTLDRIKAAFPAARRNNVLLFNVSDHDHNNEPSRLGELPGFDGETDTLSRLLDYSRESSGIWLNAAFVKPAIVGLAIWLDRMANAENQTTLQAKLSRTSVGRSGYGLVLDDLRCVAPNDTPEARKTANLRVQTVLVSAAWWGLNSPTAQRLGFVALEAEAAKGRDNKSARHDSTIRHEIGPSPYVTINEDVT